MRKLGLVGLSVLAIGTVQAQYYLNDIVNAARASEQFAALKSAGIKKVSTTSYDADGTITANFSLGQTVDIAANTITTFSKSDYTGESVLTSYFLGNHHLSKSTEVNKTYVSTTVYAYNAAGLLSSLSIVSNDSVQSFSMKEQHLYSYDAKGQPTSMLRIKNNTDTIKVVFVASEAGKPGEEQWWKGNRKIETWFYYYDAKKQLTDVARFNIKAQRILPDMMFEYDEDGRLSQQTTVHTGSNTYRIWRYIYDSRDLKIKEGVFNKYKQEEGRIEYSYQ
ncbi:MAG TPA: hypothetical protein VLC98_16545 [Phnomibacter sp.]|nr:hypothetical protein [Phnomibacter sp.]